MSNPIETKLDRIIDLLERLDRRFTEKFPTFTKCQDFITKAPPRNHACIVHMSDIAEKAKEAAEAIHPTRSYWVIVYDDRTKGKIGCPVPPIDAFDAMNGMMVYPDEASAIVAAAEQSRLYDVNCRAALLGNEVMVDGGSCR